VTRAPDLFEPVIAFRSWRVVDGELVSPHVPQRWDEGVAVARCERLDPGASASAARGEPLPFEHEAPHPDCHCGIHAYFEPRLAVPAVDFRRVLGIVVVWGRLEVHPGGVRAQFARVQALGSSSSWSSWHRADVAAIGARLGVPVVDEEALAAAAPDYGSPLPAALRQHHAAADRA
jgi:hypothetical protein